MVLKRPFTITGIVRNGKGARIFISMEAAQDMVGHPGFCTMFYVKLKDKSQTKAVIENLKEKLNPTELPANQGPSGKRRGPPPGPRRRGRR